jgi:hypothetical protein
VFGPLRALSGGSPLIANDPIQARSPR